MERRGAPHEHCQTHSSVWVPSDFVTIISSPEFYIRIIPPDLPLPEILNVVSGLAEIVLGVFLLDPRTRPFAAWGIIALLVAVFPANVYMATANVGAGGPGTGAGMINWARLPFRLLFAAWAWWYTRPDPDPR